MSYRRHESRFNPMDRQESSYGSSYGNDYGNSYSNNVMDENFLKMTKKDWTNVAMVPIKKDFYLPIDEVLQRSIVDVEAYRNDRNVNVQGNDVPNPFLSFLECNFPPEIFQCLTKEGFMIPTPIQGQGVPIGLRGQNLVGIAQTGSGKTLAYLLPTLIHVMNQPPLQRGEGPLALILAPTRELAQQIQKVLALFQNYVQVRSTVIYGGAPKDYQLSCLQRGVEVLIATPGRLIDFMDSNQINMQRVTFLVLDEADRMLDMGFKPQISKVINQIRPDRQVLMWSATWPKEVKSLAAEFLDTYTHLCVGSVELSANQNIMQIVDVCEEEEKDDKLRMLLKDIASGRHSKTIIFVRTKRKVDEIAKNVRRDGLRVAALHGNKNQGERDRVLNAFRGGQVNVLVATDVAARGLDVENVKYVINFDYPNSSEDYIHRIGRTGRNETNGTSYAFFTRDNVRQADALIAVLRESNQNVTPALLEMSQRGGGNYRKRPSGRDDYGSGAYKRPRPSGDQNWATGGNWGTTSNSAVTNRSTKSRWDNNDSSVTGGGYSGSSRGGYQSSYQAAPQKYNSGAAGGYQAPAQQYGDVGGYQAPKRDYSSGGYQGQPQSYGNAGGYQADPQTYNSYH